PVVVYQLARTVAQVLKVHVRELPGLEEIEILELAEAGPEVEEIEHRPNVGMGCVADHGQRRRQRREMRRRARELDHRGQAETARDLPYFANAIRRRGEILGSDRTARDR